MQALPYQAKWTERDAEPLHPQGPVVGTRVRNSRLNNLIYSYLYSSWFSQDNTLWQVFFKATVSGRIQKP